MKAMKSSSTNVPCRPNRLHKKSNSTCQPVKTHLSPLQHPPQRKKPTPSTRKKVFFSNSKKHKGRNEPLNVPAAWRNIRPVKGLNHNNNNNQSSHNKQNINNYYSKETDKKRGLPVSNLGLTYFVAQGKNGRKRKSETGRKKKFEINLVYSRPTPKTPVHGQGFFEPEETFGKKTKGKKRVN